MLLCIRMTFLQTCLYLLSSENSTHTPQSSLQGTEWSEIISKYVLSNSKNKSMNITSNAIVYICSTGRPRDTSLTHLGRVGWKCWFSSFFQYFRLKPPRCHSGREASSCRGRCPFQPGLAQGTWDYHCMASFWFGIGRLVRFWATVNFDIHYDGISM